MLTMPRLPTARATVCPGLIGSERLPSVGRTAAGMSWSIGPENCCLTRAMRGAWEARGIPVSLIVILLGRRASLRLPELVGHPLVPDLGVALPRPYPLARRLLED